MWRDLNNHCFPCYNTWESSSNHLEFGAEIIHCWSTAHSFRWGPTRRGSCKWDTPCGRGTAPTWSRCRITGTWRWPRWRRGPLSSWRQWTPWLVHVSATLYPADDSPTRRRRKSNWCSTTLNCSFPTNTPKTLFASSRWQKGDWRYAHIKLCGRKRLLQDNRICLAKVQATIAAY